MADREPTILEPKKIPQVKKKSFQRAWVSSILAQLFLIVLYIDES